MPRILYWMEESPPCSAVVLLAKNLGVELSLKPIILFSAEKNPDLLKANPQHLVPTLDDDGFILAESRAIMGYLVDQYSKDDSLYPKDPKKRALVNQRLYFDIGTLYESFLKYWDPLFLQQKIDVKVVLAKIEEAVGFLNSFLEGHKWVAGDNLTIADYALLVSVTNAEEIGIDLKKFPNVSKWFSDVKSEVHYTEEVEECAKKITSIIERLAKKQINQQKN